MTRRARIRRLRPRAATFSLRRRGRRGLTFIDVMAGMFILGATVLAASALFPVSALMRSRSGEQSRAAAISQKKMEQLRKLDPTTLTFSNLRNLGIVDEEAYYLSEDYEIYTFGETETLTEDLTSGEGYIVRYQPDDDLTQLEIYVFWRGQHGTWNWVHTMTYVADKSPKVQV